MHIDNAEKHQVRFPCHGSRLKDQSTAKKNNSGSKLENNKAGSSMFKTNLFCLENVILQRPHLSKDKCI